MRRGGCPSKEAKLLTGSGDPLPGHAHGLARKSFDLVLVARYLVCWWDHLPHPIIRQWRMIVTLGV
jgi:hypothetical protein